MARDGKLAILNPCFPVKNLTPSWLSDTLDGLSPKDIRRLRADFIPERSEISVSSWAIFARRNARRFIFRNIW
jgi:hypothetical protein